jgi:hypothetical protein
MKSSQDENIILIDGENEIFFNEYDIKYEKFQIKQSTAK